MDKDLLEKFLSSFEYDKRLAEFDIEACITWIKLLVKNKVVKKQEAQKVLKALEELKRNPKLLVEAEDIHYAVEETLEKLLKEDKKLAGIIRTARSRNDLVVSDERSYIKKEIKEIKKLLKELILSITNVAEKHLNTAMVGYTHLQPAQPVLFSHYILSFSWWFVRDIERLNDCYKRVDVSSLGSAAFAGSSFPIDRKDVARQLKFSKVSFNSVDSVSDRDFIAEFIFCCSTISMHLSRIAEELIIWCNPNFGYISLPKQLTSGSSIMPQKQNPDYLELIRGKTSKVYSDLLGILVLLKALPLSYNRDMQEDKVYLFSCVDITESCIQVMKLVFDNLKVNKEKLTEDLLKYDFVLATEVANFLVENLGYQYKLAHATTQRLLQYCVENKKKLINLSYEDYKKFLNELDEKTFRLLKTKLQPLSLASSYKTFGGSSLKQVKYQIKEIRNIIRKEL